MRRLLILIALCLLLVQSVSAAGVPAAEAFQARVEASDPQEPQEDAFALGTNLIIALVIGVVVSVIVVFCLKRQLKSVRMQKTAANYIRPGSLHLTGSGDIFLYHTVSRIEKPQQNSGRGK